MILVIDSGNTHCSFGLYSEASVLRFVWRFASKYVCSDEYASFLAPLLADQSLSFGDISACALASVVPQFEEELCRFAERYLGCQALRVGKELTPRAMRLDIETPHQLGADRIANAIQGWALLGRAHLVVDFGTATNFDVVDAHGHYIGGIIATGAELSMRALSQFTAQLPKITFSVPGALIGKNTHQAMASGLFFGYKAMVEGLISSITKTLDMAPSSVLATGGLGEIFAPHLGLRYEPHLTLDGIYRLWHERI